MLYGQHLIRAKPRELLVQLGGLVEYLEPRKEPREVIALLQAAWAEELEPVLLY